ncbi:methyltransferase domain-containing protein [Herbaspirillum sp. DW155]|uniref:SAM-dependent methyltransferase n=1 Tax=Herbaspirillum sp. DW155 TaxID=3095609 RepID=UPI0030864D0E|nr:methyltransferase domain-containing protein [Herbaspirillum sp. DW155]
MTAAHSPTPALISHTPDASDDLGEILQSTRTRLRNAGDLPHGDVGYQIELLEELSRFELGRFLLKNRGLNAYWTHQLVTYSPESVQHTNMRGLERWTFEKLPAAQATRERYGIFRRHLQALVQHGQVLASIPCGWMGELLLLDYGPNPDISLVGIDLDAQALKGAQALAQQQGLSKHLTLRCEDAWSAGAEAEFDVLTSNGLNIYETDDNRVIMLYRAFFRALKPGGTLVTSFLTPPPTLSTQSPWNMNEIEPQALQLQHLLFVRIIEAKWNAFRTHAQTRAQLEEAGFTDIVFDDDRSRMFPTVIAKKR